MVEQRRGKGIGKALLAFALQRLRSLGFDEAQLHVFDANIAAIRLYERLGWTTALVRELAPGLRQRRMKTSL